MGQLAPELRRVLIASMAIALVGAGCGRTSSVATGGTVASPDAAAQRMVAIYAAIARTRCTSSPA